MTMTEKKMRFYGCSILVIILLTCAGLVKLKFSREYAQTSAPAWPILFQSNLRQNAVESDVYPPYRIIWEKGVKSMIPDQPLAIDQYLIFTTKNGNINFLDIQSGKMIGENRIAPAFQHAPVIEQYTLFYAANLGKETLVSFNLLELSKNWKMNLSHLYTAPLIWKDYLYAGSKDGRFFCVNKKTGESQWQFNANASLLGIPTEKEGKIFFCDIRGSVYSVDGFTGKLQWKTDLPPNIYGGPVLSDHQLFIGNTAGTFYALDAFSGKILWQTTTGGSIYSNAALKETIVYVGNNSHKLIAMDTRNGHILWEFQTKGIINSAPLVGKNFIYFGSWDKNLYVLSRYSGELVQRIEFKRPIKTSPLLYDEKLFVHVANDHLFCIGTNDLPTGGVKK